jgi:succinoglycan biosynthesis transport protein ExoP
MQPTEGFSAPRRPMDVEDYIDILRRHKGWIFGPFLFCLVASVVGAYLWPDTYVSEGVIKVEPQQLPTTLVQGAMTQDMLDQIQSMTEQIESRAILTNIMTQYGLYPRERARQAPEDVLEQMKRDIKVEPLGVPQGGRTVPAFKVAFTYPDKHQAMKVVQDLIGKFIDADQRNVSGRASQLTGFLKDRQEKAAKELDAIETQLTAYKMQNNGTLPDQKAENNQKLQLLEQSRASVVAGVSRLQNDKLMVEGRLNLYKTSVEELAKIKPEVTAQQVQQQKSLKLQQAENQVDNLEKQVRDLSRTYTDTYPDVKAAKAQLEDAKTTRDRLVAEEAEAQKALATVPGKPFVNTNVAKEEIQRQADLSTYNMQIASDDNQIEQLNAQLKEIDQQANRLQALLNGVPQSEKEYEDLIRERDLKKEMYVEMTNSLAKGETTQEMENRQEGENLQILDPASDPDTPTYPNHGQIVAIGAAVGLLLGFMIAGAREMKDTSLKNLKDVRAYTQMAILGSIPLLENDFVVRRRRRLAWLGWTTACLTAAVLMSGSIAYYVFTTKAQ